MQQLKIGFIGLGNMGLPIARNLLKAGFNVIVYNRTSSKAEALKSVGAVVASSTQRAAENVDVVVTMVSDDLALQTIANEIVPAMKSGSIHLSMSTVSPAVVDSLIPLHTRHGVYYVGAPVMGRPPAAEAKLLFILLAGEASAKQKLQPVLASIGQRSFDFGEHPTAAHAAKLALNLMVLTNVELLSEVMLFAEKQGLDKNILFDAITNTQINSPLIKIYGDMILKEQDNPNGFATRLAFKDIALAKQAADDSKLELPLANLMHHNFQGTISAGNGDKDVSMLITYLRSRLAKE
jgi:3-hydroxyisobutyrate dehydrogenase-like beta-hydroxyacid dehydrogenase